MSLTIETPGADARDVLTQVEAAARAAAVADVRYALRLDLAAHAALSGVTDPTTLLFSESPSRIIISVRPEDVETALAIALESNAPCSIIGRVSADRLRIECGELLIDEPVIALEEKWRTCLDEHLG